MNRQDEIAARSARYARAAGALLAALALLLVLERFGWLATVRGDVTLPWSRLALAAAAAVPDAVWLAALWWLRRALREIAAGRGFGLALTQALQRVGMLLLAGSVLGVVVLPSVSTWLGEPPGYFIAYDVSKVVVGALGLALGLLGRLLQQAAELQSELDGIF
jgi:hypothetical protein